MFRWIWHFFLHIFIICIALLIDWTVAQIIDLNVGFSYCGWAAVRAEHDNHDAFDIMNDASEKEICSFFSSLFKMLIACK